MTLIVVLFDDKNDRAVVDAATISILTSLTPVGDRRYSTALAVVWYIGDKYNYLFFY
jgi:hypothetical protein